MKISATLRCIGLAFLWFILLQISAVCFQNANITIMSVLIMGLIALYINRKTGYINFAPGKNIRLQIILSVLTGIGLSFFNAVSMVQLILNGRWETVEVVNDNILFLSILSILGAIAEEIFFRGILQNICRPHFGAGLAIIIPAAIFMVFHLAPERMLHTFVGGLLFGYFYYYTGNIYTCIIMHVMTNFMWATFLNSYLLGFISLKTGILAAAGAMTVIGLLMVICLKIIFDRRIGKRQNMCKR